MCEAAAHFREKGVHVRLLFAVTAKNADEVPDFIELAQHLGADSIRFGATLPAGDNGAYVPTWAQRMAVHKHLQLVMRRLPIDASYTTSLYAPTDVDWTCRNLRNHEPAINPRGEYVFCCDTLAQGAVLGSLGKESFAELYSKGQETAERLRAERQERIRKRQFSRDFNGCEFCNAMLADLIRRQGGVCSAGSHSTCSILPHT